MEVKVLGPGCANCVRLENNVKRAVEGTDHEVTISKVEDPVDIMKYGVMSTPGLVVDEKVVSYGRVLTPEEIRTKLNL
ncbi:MAG: thioredoxin family protein [Alkalibacterium sp.]|nr:thioredoxin family protein [Alkalibacterium sp.]